MPESTEYYGLPAIAARLGLKSGKTVISYARRFGFPTYRRPNNKLKRSQIWYTNETLIRWWELQRSQHDLAAVAAKYQDKRKPKRLAAALAAAASPSSVDSAAALDPAVDRPAVDRPSELQLTASTAASDNQTAPQLHQDTATAVTDRDK